MTTINLLSRSDVVSLCRNLSAILIILQNCNKNNYLFSLDGSLTTKLVHIGLPPDDKIKLEVTRYRSDFWTFKDLCENGEIHYAWLGEVHCVFNHTPTNNRLKVQVNTISVTWWDSSQKDRFKAPPKFASHPGLLYQFIQDSNLFLVWSGLAWLEV